MLQPGTYRTAAGELLHYWIDGWGRVRCEVERRTGGERDGCEVCDGDAVLLSDDPTWPDGICREVAGLLITD